MNIVFRADASRQLGYGHVVRCLTLADALREHAQIRFVCREEEGHLCDRIQQHGFDVHRLPSGNRSNAEDAVETRAAINGAGLVADWLIVDHYGLDARWEAALRGCAQRLMVIDDLANRPHDCDTLLDQNLIADATNRYRGKVPADCNLLLGPDYALLQPIYRELRERLQPRRGPVTRILISWGGADNDDLTGRSLAAVVALGRTDISVDVVVTTNYEHMDRLRELATRSGSIRIHSDLPTLAFLMAEADLAMGAPGTSTWERLCLGLPTIAVSVADNQRPIGEELSRRGLIDFLGDKDQVTQTTLMQALEGAFSRDLNEWSERCLAPVDGRGTVRVVAAILDPQPQLFVRSAEPRDEAILLEWANDPVTRRNAFHAEHISAHEHHAWFTDRLNDPASCRLFIVEMKEGVPIGQVRFDRAGARWKISYALAPRFRGRGLGRFSLEAALRRLRQEEPRAVVFGQVKEFNRASCRIFEALGFEAQHRDGVMEYGRTF